MKKRQSVGPGEITREESFRRKGAANEDRRKSSGATSSNSGDAIRVICRFRPGRVARDNGDAGDRTDGFVLSEKNGDVKTSTELMETRAFTFDKVFGFDSTQSQIFAEVKDAIGSILAGFNGAIMAYGQTSAGKSHTMEGNTSSKDSLGIIPRCINGIFEEIERAELNIQFQVLISYYEIYCEKIRDLLNPSQSNMKVRENKASFLIQDITEISVTDSQSCFRVIEMGKTNRATSPTLMNAESSRSHSIFSITIEQRNTDTGRFRKGKLFLVDLAGSEKVSKTGASGLRLEEAKNINSSLTTLGMVINALSDGSSHVPYRDSKLTMLLMEALGGNSKTTLIICCNPEAKHSPETISTLRFGERAKKIKNHAKVNEELSIDELKNLLAAARKEIAQLKKRLVSPLDTDGAGEAASVSAPLSTLSSNLDDQADLFMDEVASGLLEAPLPETPALVDGGGEIEVAKESKKRILELEEECENLKRRITSLEEELETERLRVAEEHEEGMQRLSQVEAFKVTIQELEARLLKALKGRSISSTGEPVPLDVLSDAVDSEAVSPPPSLASSSSPSDYYPTSISSRHQHRSYSTSDALPGQRARQASRSRRPEGRVEGPDSDDENVVVTTYTSWREDQEESEMEKVDEEASRSLARTLGAEIKDLSRTVSMHEVETRHAQLDAQSYAEKYTKLREEYETHVKRLMLKLTNEQQVRTSLEDKLEDAYQRLWKATNQEKSKSGVFGSWFSKAHDMAVGSNSGRDSRRTSFNDREQNLIRSLELAQRRVVQLSEEVTSLQEAQSIVLETKESVMRSLARQNSQLIIERDGLMKRNEELVTTIEQLTTLLRSKESRSHDSSSAAPLPSSRFTSVIHGGHHRLSSFQATSLPAVADEQEAVA